MTESEHDEQFREQLVSVSVHALRGPATVISGYAALALEGSLGEVPPLLREALETMAEKAREMNATIDQLLTLTRVREERLPIDLQPLDALLLARAAADRATARAELSGGSVALEVDPRPHVALADRRVVEQVVDNLLDNALKHTGDHPHVVIGVEGENGEVRLCVADSGPGIPADERDAVFEPFRRGSTARGSQGSGLGLYLSRELARKLGGELVLDHAPGGARFVLTLPEADC